MAPEVRIGLRSVGADHPVFIIAEAGVNHNGDLDQALALVDAAADSGAQAVKFQAFRAAELATADAGLAAYQAERDLSDSQVDMLKRLELSEQSFTQLAARAESRGVVFLASVFDERSLGLLDRLDLPAFKIGSGDLTNLPLIRDTARRKRPLLLSTGMATLEEVDRAVRTAAGSGARGLALLHCVSSYPTPPQAANLRAMDALGDAFDVPIGYSDHCLGLEVSLAAVARGACIIERHLTLDRTLSGPDHAISLEPADLAELVRRTRVVESALGHGRKEPQPVERSNIEVVRRSLIATRDMEAGERVSRSAIAIKRPGGGLPPSELERVTGMTLARPIRREEVFTERHLRAVEEG